MRFVLAACLLLVACGESAGPVASKPQAGQRLEAAGLRRGIISDPTNADPAGLYASETDTVCIARRDEGYAIGAAVDYGEGQDCVARGTASGRGRLAMTLSDECRFTATVEGDRIVFPAVLPAACDRSCRGRGSLSALSAPLLSRSSSESRSSVAPDGAALCP